MSVSRRLRFEILRRDGMTCRYCGGKAPDVTLTVDHVVPVALGGGDEPNNLVTACQDCNSGKSSMAPDAALVEDVDATALLFAKALDRVNEARQKEGDDLDDALRVFNEEWDACWGTSARRQDGWENSFAMFLRNGLTITELLRYIEVTERKFKYGGWGAWKYFCGCCWREIGTRQELARQLIEDGEV